MACAGDGTNDDDAIGVIVHTAKNFCINSVHVTELLPILLMEDITSCCVSYTQVLTAALGHCLAGRVELRGKPSLLICVLPLLHSRTRIFLNSNLNYFQFVQLFCHINTIKLC